MAEQNTTMQEMMTTEPNWHVASSPHVASTKLTTRKMMLDVIIGLVPVLVAAGIVFQLFALKQIAICVASCVAAEMIFTAMRRRRATVGDFSAVVTGLILALSLPGTAPWYVGVIGSVVAIGIGKVVFGGVGQNIFNPAMAGRAFVMIAFAGLLGAPGYVYQAPETVATVSPMKMEEVLVCRNVPVAITQATPMHLHKQEGVVTPLWELFLGGTNGSVGETSALACLLGGLYLCWRRTASWEIPLGVLLAVLLIGGIHDLLNPGVQWTVLHDLFGGAILFGAFFIATDPVTSPLTPKGKFIFGVGIGALVMLMRNYSSYPEGVMFSVLLMNSVVPLINRWTIPRPLGGPAPKPAAK
jgi:electron transport complex protein RnfD